MTPRLRSLEQNSGRVEPGPPWRLALNPQATGYSNSQIDDYGNKKRRDYLWHAGTRMNVRARFSHSVKELVGTAGFGFWNAPFGDMRTTWPALPRATWFFYASNQNNLPYPLAGPGRGWFACTMDASSLAAISMVPFAPAILLLNNIKVLRNRLWPAIRRRLMISFAPVPVAMNEWHTYELIWLSGGCQFLIDEKMIMYTKFSPQGPLAFVAWIDNQYLVATPDGRFGWGTIPIVKYQELMITDLEVASFDSQ